MRPNPRVLHHARALIVGAGGLVVLWVAIGIARGGLGHGPLGPLAAAVGSAILIATAWLGWIDLVSVLSLSIDEKAISIGWPTRRVIAWHEVTSVSRSLGTLRLVVRTKRGTERVQLLVDRAPPAALAKLVRNVRAGWGRVEEYLEKLAEYLESAPPDE